MKNVIFARLRVLGREPALILSLVATAVKLLSAFVIAVSPDQQAVINAAAAALVGVLVAAAVHNGLPAAILGLAQALISLAVGFGLHLAADQQAVLMSFAGSVVAMFVRTQVIAPVPAGAVGSPPAMRSVEGA